MTEENEINTSNGSVQINNPNRFENVNLAFDYGTNSKIIPAESTELNTLSRLSLNNNDKEVEGKVSNVAPLSNIAEAEEQIKKIPYPKSIFFVISTVIGTSFAFFGMQSILVLYLSRQLGYSNDDATIIFHIFAMSAYFLCIMGAIIAESWLGRFKTIFYFLIAFVTGLALISLGAMPPLNLPATLFTLMGLMLCAMGVGGAQPCIPAFGGDQFKLPEQESKITTFFSFYYFSLNAAALLGYAITPIFREDVHCFDEKECYSLAFGVPTLVLCTSTIMLILTRPFYKITPSSGNMVVLVSKTIGSAISNKWKERKTHPREHWLDYADKKYEYQLIEDIQVLTRVLVLYLPLPFFWALFYQQGSRWTLQATRMNGDMGSWDIKPEQMQLLNPLLVLLFIPLCEFVIYPLLNLVGFRRPLQKLSLGGIFAGMAFIISGLLELNMEQTYPTLPSAGIAQLRVYNGELCDYSITTNLNGLHFDINSLDNYVNKSTCVDSSNGLSVQFEFHAKSGANCATLPNQSCFLKSEKSYYVFLNSKNTTHPVVCAEDTIAKPNRGFPLGRTLANVNPSRKIQWKNSKGLIEHTEQAYQRNLTELKADTYQILIDDVQVESAKLEVGGIYTVIIAEESSSKYRSKVVIVTEPNSVSILWLIPQYVVMTLGEVMFSVTGFEFSYSQAPDTMKSVLQAVWLLTIAFGNLIVVIVAELPIFDSQASEFFLFSGLMFADMIIFMFVAYYYKPNNPAAKSEAEALRPVEKSVKGFDNAASTIDE